jgi:hypothetical protein
MIKMEEKGNKIYIYVKDEDNEIEPVEWTTVVEKTEFEQCVKKKKEAGYEDPKESAMLDYALFDNCAIPLVTTG